jgi:hypothetical protein
MASMSRRRAADGTGHGFVRGLKWSQQTDRDVRGASRGTIALQTSAGHGGDIGAGAGEDTDAGGLVSCAHRVFGAAATEACATCGAIQSCEGHLGHVECGVPTYPGTTDRAVARLAQLLACLTQTTQADEGASKDPSGLVLGAAEVLALRAAHGLGTGAIVSDAALDAIADATYKHLAKTRNGVLCKFSVQRHRPSAGQWRGGGRGGGRGNGPAGRGGGGGRGPPAAFDIVRDARSLIGDGPVSF